MSEYIITIDDWFFKPVHERYTHFFGCPIEKIVRCRDCTNKQPYDEPMGCDCLCGLFWIEVEPDGFCAWGERRSE